MLPLGGISGTKALAAFTGVLVIALSVSLLLSILIMPFVHTTASSWPGGSCTSSTSTSITRQATSGQTASASQTPAGPQPSSKACQAVRWALAMSEHLYGTPDVTYDSGFPIAIIQFGKQTCPGCAAWQNGQFQCVVYVLGAYGLVHPFPAAGNANQWWSEYSHIPGYQEISAAATPFAERGLPTPGDVMAWSGGMNGHVSIVIQVIPPSGTQAGAITFGQANGQMPIQTLPLLPDLTVNTNNGYWNGFSVQGYIRLTTN